MPALANNGGSSVSSDYSGHSIKQLEALIAKLQARIVEMRNGAKCYVTKADLSLGDGEGGDMADDVRRLQSFLAEKGFLKYKATGYFGKMTRTAVLAFQAQQGIAQTGEFDLATREKAHSLTCDKTIAPKPKKEEKKDEPKGEAAAPTSSVRSITLTGTGTSVRWTVDGNPAQGVKVVWSKNQSPTYPPREGDRAEYHSNPTDSEATISAFDGAGKYYVRICEYNNGSCGVHSNQIEVQL